MPQRAKYKLVEISFWSVRESAYSLHSVAHLHPLHSLCNAWIEWIIVHNGISLLDNYTLTFIIKIIFESISQNKPKTRAPGDVIILHPGLHKKYQLILLSPHTRTVHHKLDITFGKTVMAKKYIYDKLTMCYRGDAHKSEPRVTAFML